MPQRLPHTHEKFRPETQLLKPGNVTSLPRLFAFSQVNDYERAPCFRRLKPDDAPPRSAAL
jgi:hypothetical protein